MAEILASAQLFVPATRWEGLLLRILKAVRAGLPVVASGASGVQKEVADGSSLPGRPEALAGALEGLLGSARLRARIGRVGRDRYEEHFTFDRMFEDTLRVYTEVV